MHRLPCDALHATHCMLHWSYCFFACAASQGSFHRYFDCSKACDALAEEAVVWICTCVSGLQILLLSSYIIAARLLLRNRSLIALLKIRTEQEFKKTPQIFALLLRAWGTVFYECSQLIVLFFVSESIINNSERQKCLQTAYSVFCFFFKFVMLILLLKTFKDGLFASWKIKEVHSGTKSKVLHLKHMVSL